MQVGVEVGVESASNLRSFASEVRTSARTLAEHAVTSGKYERELAYQTSPIRTDTQFFCHVYFGSRSGVKRRGFGRGRRIWSSGCPNSPWRNSFFADDMQWLTSFSSDFLRGKVSRPHLNLEVGKSACLNSPRNATMSEKTPAAHRARTSTG